MSCYLSNLIKNEDPAGYAKLAREGLMLGHPVKINGETHRKDNGIEHHSTIKFFDPATDHPHQIHSLARHLPLNAPDAKNTQIEPGEFKDRNGATVYVLKLKGNSAEKMKEHNGKFAHMGPKTNYEFQPHISVPKDVHDRIKSSGFKTAHEAGIEFGPAELKRGPKTLKTYHHKPDTTEPTVPDESDFTAKINAPKTAVGKSESTTGQKPLMKPFLSEAQRRWGHTAAGKEALGGEAGVHEWDEATKGKKLPERVGKSLEKGALKNVGVALGMAGALAAAPHSGSTLEHGPGYDRQKMLNAISQVESSGGKNTHHKPLNNGQHAYGKYALTPNTIQDTIKSNPDLKAKYGKALALKGDTIHHYMADNKGLEDIIADRHLKHLENHFGGNLNDLGVSWLNGVQGTNKAKKSGKDLSNHWYAKKIKENYGRGK